MARQELAFALGILKVCGVLISLCFALLFGGNGKPLFAFPLQALAAQTPTATVTPTISATSIQPKAAPTSATPTATKLSATPSTTATATRIPPALATATRSSTRTATVISSATATPSRAPTLRPTSTRTPTRRAARPGDLPFKVFLPLVSSNPISSFAQIDQDLADGIITIDQAATYKTYALFGVGSPTLPDRYNSTVPVPGDGTILFLEALKDWDSLSTDTKNLINDFITPKDITGTLPLSPARVSPTRTSPASPSQRPIPGIQRIRGVITAIAGTGVQLDSQYGSSQVSISSASPILLGNQKVTLLQLQNGDLLDGLANVDDNGQMSAIHLSVTRRPNTTSSRPQKASSQVSSAADASVWSPKVPISQGYSYNPSIALDSHNNLYGVWAAEYTPQDGLWYARKDSINWRSPQPITGTTNAAYPSLAVDSQDTVQLVWQERKNSLNQAFYSSGHWNGAVLTWTAPVTISQVISDSTNYSNVYSPRIAATFANNQIQLHAIWGEYLSARSTISSTWMLKYSEWRVGTAWSAPLTITSTSSLAGNSRIAIDRMGRVGVTYQLNEQSGSGYIGHIYYQECNLANVNGDCANLASWSAPSDAALAPNNVTEIPNVAFDTGGKVSMVWEDYRYSQTNLKDIFYNIKPSPGLGWGTPTNLTENDHLRDPSGGVMSFPEDPIIIGGTPNNLFAVWYQWVFLEGVNHRSELHYTHWDGYQWSTPAKLDDAEFWYSWTSAVVDGNNNIQLIWEGYGGTIYYSSAPSISKGLGACVLTEYYDTQHFRIYYTRTYPNTYGQGERDCRIQNPTRLNNNGYPDFVVELGDSLEASYGQFGTRMGYPVGQIPHEQASGRYPIFISSGPIWTGNPIIDLYPQHASMTLPDRMVVNHSVPYSPTQPIDWLRELIGAHELFHTVQWTYVPNAPIGGQGGTWATNEELRWWMEATAVWAEPKVYPQGGAYPRDLDLVLREPYRSLINRPLLVAGTSYGGFIFPTYLEQKAANSETLIRQTWERYRANNGGSTVVAIDQVLGTQYATTLADEFPKFAWNNYFLNDGTYTRNVTVYPDVDNPAGNPVIEPEWQLFRSKLYFGRENYQNGNAGVLVERVDQFPANGPVNQLDWVQTWGAAYLEFFPTNLNVPPGSTADLNLIITIPVAEGANTKVSILAIQDFSATPHPANNFIVPTMESDGLNWFYKYRITVPNFNQQNRVAAIISNPGAFALYSYQATVAIH